MNLHSRTLFAKWGRTILSYGIGAGCLYWVFHDLRLQDIWGSILRTEWWWLLPAIALALLVYGCAAWEWQILLRPVGQIPIGRALEAVLVGRLANDVLPVHIGYLFRVYLASRRMAVEVMQVIPSLLVERLFDGIPLALGIGLTALSFPLPTLITRVAELWAAIVVFGITAFAIIIFRGRQGSRRLAVIPSRWKWASRVEMIIRRLLHELGRLARSRAIVEAFALAQFKFALQALAFFALFRAYGFHLAFAVELAVFLIAFVGLSMPSTPASVGVFQVFCISGLRFFGIDKVNASGFALLAFVVLTLPLSAAGALALARSGISLNEVRRGVADDTNSRLML